MNTTWKRVLWTFGQAFTVSFFGFVTPWLSALAEKPALDLKVAKASIVAGLIGGGAAGLSALKNLLFKPGSKFR